MQLGTQVGCTKMPFLKVAVLCCYGNNGCLFEAWGLIFIQKRRKKRVKCLFLYLKLNTILQIGTSSSNIIRLHIDSFNVSDKWNMQGFERMLSYEQYPEEKSRLCLSSFKKIDQPSCRRTTAHIIQIPSAVPSFMGIWAIRSPLNIHCYTCMSFKTCWSRLSYTKLSSHRSFVTFSGWRDAVFLREVSIGRPKEDEKWTSFDISADFCAF